MQEAQRIQRIAHIRKVRPEVRYPSSSPTTKPQKDGGDLHDTSLIQIETPPLLSPNHEIPALAALPRHPITIPLPLPVPQKRLILISRRHIVQAPLTRLPDNSQMASQRGKPASASASCAPRAKITATRV